MIGRAQFRGGAVYTVACSLMSAAAASCSFGDLDHTGRACPCGPGWVCSAANVCVEEPSPDQRSDGSISGFPSRDAGIPNGRDAGVVPTLDGGPIAPPDTGLGDGATGAPDAGDVPPRCGSAPDDPTVSLYRFEDIGGGALRDEIGGRHGSLVGAGSPLLGPPGCGNAVAFGGGAYGVIADDPAWQLSSGALDFWFRPPAVAPADEPFGLISRDATGEGPQTGHLAVVYTSDRRVAVRLQIDASILFLCSESVLTPEQWVHLGINFGAPEVTLHVDGRRETGAGQIFFATSLRNCGATEMVGVAGNQEPWVLGAGGWRSGVRSATPIVSPLEGGALDEMRISTARRDFAGFQNRQLD